jgi:ATP-dependent protease HslVU (ClpYQ) peptidase subunit
MTCIVAVKEGNKIVIGADSCVTGSYETLRGTPKVVRKGEFLLGGSGRARGNQLFQYSVNFPNICEGEEHYHYLINTVTPLMRKTFTDHGFLRKKDSEEETSNNFMLVFRGEIYTIGSDFFVNHPRDEYLSIGSGTHFALGSLYSTKELNMSPENRVELALEAASTYNGFVSPPFEIISMQWEGYENGDKYIFYDSDGSIKEDCLVNDKPKGE